MFRLDITVTGMCHFGMDEELRPVCTVVLAEIEYCSSHRDINECLNLLVSVFSDPNWYVSCLEMPLPNLNMFRRSEGNSDRRITEWPGLKSTAVLIQFQPLLCAGSPTSRPGCPEPHPAWDAQDEIAGSSGCYVW